MENINEIKDFWRVVNADAKLTNKRVSLLNKLVVIMTLIISVYTAMPKNLQY